MSAAQFTLNAGSVDGRNACVLKIQTPDWELNVWMWPEEIDLLPSVREATWSDRRSVAIGTSAGSRVFWSCQDGQLNILIGHDDETWDVSVSIPESAIDNMLKEVGNEAPGIFPGYTFAKKGE